VADHTDCTMHILVHDPWVSSRFAETRFAEIRVRVRVIRVRG